MPYCPKCGTEVSEGTQSCPKCGRQLTTEQKVKRMSKKKLAGIIVGSIIGLIVIIAIIAAIVAPSYTLSISANPSGAGSISPSGGKYKSGMEVTVIATPDSGYTFDYWSGAASGTTSTITITMDSNKSLTANFKRQTYTLTISASPSGAGSVSPSSGEYESGVQVTLTASPASGYTFDHWSGSVSDTASSITITMDSNKSLTANFKATIQTYTLTVNVSPSGAGSVSPLGGQYEPGVSVTLTATPANGYTFDYWSGSASGTTSTITITMNSDKTLTANFKTTPAQVAIKITAEQLVSEYDENQVRADLNYKDKVLEVSGTVDYIGEVLFSNEPSVSLTAGFLSSVVCLFDSSWQSEVAQLQKGQHVIVQGRCTGESLPSTVYLEDCKLI